MKKIFILSIILALLVPGLVHAAGGITAQRAAITTLTTAASAYSAGANLVAMCDGTEFRLWYNNTHIGTGTDPALPAGTRAGLYTTDTGNGVDNFNAWARGTEGQYSAALDRFLY